MVDLNDLQCDGKVRRARTGAGLLRTMCGRAASPTILLAGFLALPAGANEPSLAASVLPASRSVQTGMPATGFATIINSGEVAATSCHIQPATEIDATFSFSTTDPATNVPTGSPGEPVDIAAGATQTFVFSFVPREPFPPTDIELGFDCGNSEPAPTRSGVNTFLLSSSDEPVPDIVALSTTGQVTVPDMDATGIMAVAISNVGARGTITASADAASTLPLGISLCRTDAMTGECMDIPASEVTFDTAGSDAATFGVFIRSCGPVALDPAENRISIRFHDEQSVTRGSTSVAIAVDGTGNEDPNFAETLTGLIGNGADIGAATTLQRVTPLHVAALAGRSEGRDFAGYLACNELGWTPLHDAVRAGGTAAAESLLNANASIEATTSDLSTPLHWAARYGTTDIVETLLDADASIEAMSDSGGTPLHGAAWDGRADVVEILLDRGARIEATTNFGDTPLHGAAQLGRTDVVEVLLDANASIEARDDSGNTPLHGTAQLGRTDVVEILLSRGANIEAVNNFSGDTPLLLAAKNGGANIVEMLLRQGANIDAIDNIGRTPLHEAAGNGWAGVVEILLREGTDIEARSTALLTPLHLASLYGRADIVDILLRENANIEAMNFAGGTPLHEAGNAVVAEILLREGANIEAMDNIFGHTPLHEAINAGVAEILLREGANIETRSASGLTPLHLAARLGKVDVVESLLREGANIETMDDIGYTPLHDAARSATADVVEALLRAGANIRATGPDGILAADLAEDNPRIAGTPTFAKLDEARQ